MIILIAPEGDISNEIDKLNQLFKAGVACFHLRKPKKNYQEHCHYLNQIDRKYHNRIVVHSFHELINNFDLKGIHFPEQRRQNFIKDVGTYYSQLNMKNKTVSSSFHKIAMLKNCPFVFDYHFLSPVFSSISKQGYKGRGFNVNQIHKKVIGMGGVTVENLVEFKRLGFQGVGVLGSIWNSKEPVNIFKKMKDQWNTSTK